MKVLRSIIQDVGSLRERFLSQMAYGGLFVPQATDLRVGEEVCLWIQLRCHCAEVYLYGTVYWLRHLSDEHSKRLRSGAGIGFRGGQEDRVSLLRDILAGNANPLPARRFRRTPLTSPWRCQIQLDQDRTTRPAMLADVGRGGAMIITGPPPPPADTRVLLSVPWHSETRYPMEVAWNRSADTRARVGLRHARRSRKVADMWADLVAEAQRQFNDQIWHKRGA